MRSFGAGTRHIDVVQIDLIHKGIKTGRISLPNLAMRSFGVQIDLIHKGIKTDFNFEGSGVSGSSVQIDLIHKGIKTLFCIYHIEIARIARTNRPDS